MKGDPSAPMVHEFQVANCLSVFCVGVNAIKEENRSPS